MPLSIIKMSRIVPEWLRTVLTYGFLAWMIFIGLWVYQIRRFGQALTISQQNRVIEDQVVINVTKAETGQRGYLLTGNMEYLRSYYGAVDQLHANVRTLKVFLRTNENQTVTIVNLDNAIGEKLKEMDSTILAYQKAGPDSALKIVKTDKGLTKMREIEDLLNTLIAEERDRTRRLAASL